MSTVDATEPPTALVPFRIEPRAGLTERLGILFGVSWEYFRSGPSPAEVGHLDVRIALR